MTVGGKRSVAMMLGTDWTSGPPVAAKPPCTRCNRHNGRRPKTSAEKAALAKTRPDLLGRCCNGTRVAGDAWVQCDSFGWITLCCGCNRVIPPKWLLTKEQRQEMSANGMDVKQLVELNKVLLAEEQERKAEAARTQEK